MKIVAVTLNSESPSIAVGMTGAIPKHVSSGVRTLPLTAWDLRRFRAYLFCASSRTARRYMVSHLPYTEEAVH